MSMQCNDPDPFLDGFYEMASVVVVPDQVFFPLGKGCYIRYTSFSTTPVFIPLLIDFLAQSWLAFAPLQINQ